MFAGRPEIHPKSDVNKVMVPVSGAFVIGQISGWLCGAALGAYKEHRLIVRTMILQMSGGGEGPLRIFPGFPAATLAAVCSTLGTI